MNTVEGNKKSLDISANVRRLSSISDDGENTEYSNYISFYQCPQIDTTPIAECDKYKWRVCVIVELDKNEFKFYSEMRMLSLLLTSGEIAVPISTEDFKSIYNNIGDYIKVSKNILQSIKMASAEVKEPFDACVGKYFLKNIPEYKDVLLKFIREFDPMLLDKRPHLRKYCETASQILHKKDGSTLLLFDRILVAFQRPFKITCLFERLLKNTPETHADYENLIKVVKEMTEITARAENLRRNDSQLIGTYPVSTSNETDTKNIMTILKNGNDGQREYYETRCEANLKFAEFLVKWFTATTESIIIYVTQRRTFVDGIDDVLASIDKVRPSIGAKLIKSENNMILSANLKSINVDIITKLSNIIRIFKKPKAMEKQLVCYFKEYKKLKLRYASSSNIPVSSLEHMRAYLNLQASFVKHLQELHKISSKIISLCLHFHRNAVQKFLLSSDRATSLELRNTNDLLVTTSGGISNAINVCLNRCLNPSISSKNSLNLGSTRTSAKESLIGNCSERIPAVIKYFYANPENEADYVKVGQFVTVENIGDDSGNVEWSRIRTASHAYYWYPTTYLNLVR